MSGPLEGYRVLELGSTVAGPFCGRIMGDFGAEVIKVEPPEGDPVRNMGAHLDGRSLYAASILRNKSLLVLDLRKPQAREVVRDLLAKCDVLVENFRPGTLERWGLGFDALSRAFPRLVMVRISGYGQTGPYRGRPGYGFLGDAVGGLLHINGYPDRAPVRAAVPVTDMVTATNAALGAVMALLAREKTGRGQCIDAALCETAFGMMEEHVPAYDKLGRIPGRSGSRLPGSTPNSLYPTADGGYLAVAAASDAVFRRLVAVMAQPGLADDERFATGMARNRNVEALDGIIGQWTRGFPLRELEAKLQASEVPASSVYTIADVFADPHFAERGAIARIEDPELGEVAMTAPLPRLSDTPGTIRRAGGRTGRDTVAVLRQVCGYDEDRIRALRECGAIGAATD